MDDALRCGQADTGAGELKRRVQPLKRAEELSGIGHIEAGAIVADEVGSSAVARLDAKLNSRVCQFAGEFPGIDKEVLKHDAQELTIAVGDDPVRDYTFDRTLGLTLSKLCQNAVRNRAQVDRLT